MVQSFLPVPLKNPIKEDFTTTHKGDFYSQWDGEPIYGEHQERTYTKSSTNYDPQMLRILLGIRQDIQDLKKLLLSNIVAQKQQPIALPEKNEPKEEVLSLRENEKRLIQTALKKFYGNRKKAAQSLGISERTLYRKIKQYDINIEEE